MMPNAIVWHGSVYVRPQVPELTPPSATKIAGRIRNAPAPSQCCGASRQGRS
jgi:hypothetical protein